MLEVERYLGVSADVQQPGQGVDVEQATDEQRDLHGVVKETVRGVVLSGVTGSSLPPDSRRGDSMPSPRLGNPHSPSAAPLIAGILHDRSTNGLQYTF